MPDLLDELKPVDTGDTFSHRVWRGPFADDKPNRGFVGTATSSLARGKDQLVGTGYALAGVIADTFGADQFAQSAMQGYTRKVAEAGLNPAEIGTYKNIESLGDVGTYINEAVFENLPNMVASMGGGGVGSMTGGMLARRGIAKRVAERALGERFGAEAAAKVIAGKQLLGAEVGAFAANTGQEIGSIGGDIFEKSGQIKPLESIVGGVAAGAVETLGELGMLKKVFGEAVAGKLNDRLRWKLARIGETAGKQFSKEAVTEAIQTGIEEASAYHAMNEPEKPFWTPELVDSLIDSALKGGAAGAVMGMGGQIVEEARRKERVNGLRATAQQNRDVGNIETAKRVDQQADDEEFKPATADELRGKPGMTTTTPAGATVVVNQETGGTNLGELTPTAPAAATPISPSPGAEAMTPEAAPAPVVAPAVVPPGKPIVAKPTPQEEFAKLLAEQGTTPEEHARNSATSADLVPMPEAFSRRVKIGPSEIAGDGVILTKPMNAGQLIVPALLLSQATTEYDASVSRTPAGRYINHADDANTSLDVQDGQVVLVAKRRLAPGEELTVNYREQAAAVEQLQGQVKEAAASVNEVAEVDVDTDATLPDLDETPATATVGGAAAYAKVLAWLNAESKAGRPVGRAASALQNARKLRLDPEIENDLLGLLRKAGVEDNPPSFEGQRFDDWWDDFNKASETGSDSPSGSNPAPAKPVTFQIDDSNWYKKSPTGKVGVVNFGTTVPSRVHEVLFTVDSRGKFVPSETGKRVGIKQGGNLGSVSLAYDWTLENEALMRQLVLNPSPPVATPVAKPVQPEKPQVLFTQGQRVRSGNIVGNLAIYDDGRLAIRTDKGSEFPVIGSNVVAEPAAAPDAKPVQVSTRTQIGVNSSGLPLFEDANGVRSYVENGVRVTESVPLGPRGEVGKPSPERRRPDFQVAEPSAAPTPAPAPSTAKLDDIKARRAELQRKLREKLKQVGSAPDPEILTLAAQLAASYAEEGVVKFADFASRVKADMGDVWQQLQRYLHAAWQGAGADNPSLEDVSRKDAAQQMAEVDSAAAVAEPTTEAQNETRPDIREGDQSGKSTPVSGGDAAAPAANAGSGGDVALGVPGAGEGAVSGGNSGGNGQRAGRPGAVPGAQDTGGILGGTPAGGAGAAAAQPGDGSGVSEPAHNDVGRGNYHLTNPEAIVGGGPKARFNRNQEALETYHTLLAEQRSPTTAELDKLAGYTGWGSFGQELFNGSWDAPRPKSGWEIEDAWLRDQLGEEGWKSAQQSIINAHYTDPVTVTAMWDMVRRMGFTGGRVLEPSVGIGNFFSLMPRDLMAASTLTGIELDQFTGRMAQMLHPQANIQIKGYQDSKTADNFYDLVIGNWPFADVKPADRRYNHLNANLHDYFFIKALDQVRPGGIVIGITSAGTMDKKSPAIRRYLASRAELVATFRLPAGTFGKYAGTSVTTDIIILKKRETPVPDPKDNWIESKEMVTPAGNFSYNQFYWDSPKNIIGTIGFGRGTTSGRPGMIVTPPPNHEQAIRNLAARVPADVFQPWSKANQVAPTIANTDSGARQLSIVEKGGELYQVQGEQLVVADKIKSWKKKSIKENQQRLQEARDAIAMRTELDALMAAYRSGAETEAPRKRLKQAYTSFVAKHGSVRDSFMLRYMEKLQDSSAISVFNLEDDNGRPREVLERDVLRRKPAGVQVGNIDDAFAMQRNNALHFSLEEVAKLAQTTPEAVRARLVELGQIFQTPTGQWQARDEYLSDNVRRKLREAEAAQEQGVDMTRNIEALKAVMPRDTPHFEIEVRMGANWVTVPDYKDFVASLIPAQQDRIAVDRMATGWNVKVNDDNATSSNEATVVWGHRRKDAGISMILTNAMNGTQVRIYDPTDDGPVFNQKDTEEVNGKIEAIREQFQKWIWQDSLRTARLTAEYNEVANSLVTPQRDGSYLRLEGLALKLGNSEFDFRKHQIDGIARGTQDGKGMFAHEVGTGKTFTMAGLAMEGRRLGVFRKPLIFAHNANSASVRSDFQAAYPSGKFLYLDSLTPQERQSRLRQIALDDWDSIIVPHSLINRFTLSETTMMELARDEIQALEDEIAAVMADIGASYTKADLDDPKAMNKALAFKQNAHTAKKLVKQRLRILERIKKKAQEASTENAVLFEELGVDAIMVDEAHIFKKISLATRKQIKGLSKDESGAGFALSLLTDYVKKQNNGKGVFLFTGTPVTNTLNEVYNMMRYVMSSDMTQAGIQRFDDWFNMFADSETEVEMTEAGTYEAVDRLRAFINVSELARMAGRYFDVVFAKNMPEFKDRTSPDGMTENPMGRPFKKVIPVTADMSPEQLTHLASIRERFSRWKEASGKVRRQMMMEGKDTPLQLGTESSLAALDFRLVDKDAPDYKGSKANAAVVRLLDIYRESQETVQMVFMEQGYNDYTDRTKKVKNADGTVKLNADGEAVTEKTRVEKFNLARDMVEKLVAGGVKPEEIAIFANVKLNPVASDPNDVLRKVNRVSSAVTKEDLAKLMREGKIRVAFGQTATMGTGVNAQTFLRAMHHLDAPWQPGEFEQRNGRGWRQGNKWNTVLEHRYFAEGSGDGKRWQFLLNKVRFITRFMEALSKTGQDNLRTLEGEGADASDANDTVADFEQSFGTAAGDPRQMLKATLLKKIRKLEIKRDNHSTGVYRAQQTIDGVRGGQRRREQMMAKRDGDSKAFNALSAQPFSIEIEGKTYTDRKEADEAFKRVPVQVEQNKIGQWGDFKITALRDRVYLVGPSGLEHQASATVGSIAANLRNIQHYTDGMRADLKRDLESIPKLEEMASNKFSEQDKLNNTRMALKQIEAEIDLSPFPAPSWLRNSVPMGSAIYLKQDGKLVSVDVAAHRWDANNWWVLYEDAAGQMRPLPYTEVLDETGNPMFEVRPFEKPPMSKAAPAAQAGTPAPVAAPSTDQAIAYIDTLMAQLNNNLYSDPLLLTPIAKLAIKIARALLVAGRTLEVAIREAIAQAKAQMPGEVVDEAQLATAMTEGVFAQAPEAAPQAAPYTGETKESTAVRALEPIQYRSTTNAEGESHAADFIDRAHGGDLASALHAAMSPDALSGLDDRMRIFIGGTITNRAAALWREGDASMQAVASEAAKWLQQLTLSGAGQTLQAGNWAKNNVLSSGAIMDLLGRTNDPIDASLKLKFGDVFSDKIRAWLLASGRKAVAGLAELMSKTNNVSGRVLRIVGRDAGINWNDLFTSAEVDQKAVQKDLFAKIREHPKLQGLSEAEAVELTNILTEAWLKERRKVFLTEFRKEVALPNVKETDKAELESALPELLKQLNLGLLSNEAFRNALAPKYGLKPITDAQAKALYDKAQQAQAKPEGWQRNEAVREVINEMVRLSGISKTEMLKSWWYASVLSGLGTQGRNIVGNAAVLMESMVASIARNPRAAGALVAGMLRGMRENATQGEFSAIMHGRMVARPGMDIEGSANTLELIKDSPHLWQRVLASGRYVTRFMLAADSFFYDANAEVAAINTIVSQNRGATWAHVEAQIFEQLNLSPEKRAAAEAKAKAEGLSGSDLNRRVVEILEQTRPSEIVDAQHRFALEATLNNEPQGLLGHTATALMAMRKMIPPLTAVVPFIRISANVGNMLLQHSPAGLYWVLRNWRTEGQNWSDAKTGAWTGYAIGIKPDITPEEYQQLRAKVLLSHAAMMMTLAWAASGADDDEPWFQVTGSMQGVDPDKRRQLEEQGIRPYSLKFGNRSFDYRLTPWAFGLANVGQVMDGKRYDPKWDEHSAMSKFATAAAGGKFVIMDQSFLSNLMVLLERGPQLAKDQNTNTVLAFLARTAGGAIPTLLKESDSWMDPEVRKAQSGWDYFQREIPFSRRNVGTPLVNVLGEPVERPRYPWSWLTSEASSDPVWQALGEKASKGVFLPVPSAAATVLANGKRVKMTPEQFAKYQAEVGKLYREKLTRDLGRFERMTPEQAGKYFKQEFEPLREQARTRVR